MDDTSSVRTMSSTHHIKGAGFVWRNTLGVSYGESENFARSKVADKKTRSSWSLFSLPTCVDEG